MQTQSSGPPPALEGLQGVRYHSSADTVTRAFWPNRAACREEKCVAFAWPLSGKVRVLLRAGKENTDTPLGHSYDPNVEALVIVTSLVFVC